MEYIPILSPLSLNKNIKKTSEKPTGDLVELENYIPSNKILKTREGITEFSWSEAVVGENLKIYMTWDSNPVDCEIQGADYFTISGTVDVGGILKMVGPKPLRINASDPTSGGVIIRACNALPTVFPGVDSQDILCGLWFYYGGASAINRLTKFLMKGSTLANPGTFHVTQDTGVIVFRIRNSANDAYLEFTSDVTVVFERYYHVGIWHSSALDRIGIRVFDKSMGVMYNNAWDYSGGLTFSTTNYFAIGGQYTDPNYANTMYGWLDDFRLYCPIPDSEANIISKIDDMRVAGEDNWQP